MDVEEAVATTQSEDLGGAAVSQSDDKIISAEIPDESTPERRELRKIVLRTMVHMRHEMLQRQGRGARRRRSPARRRRPRAEECRAPRGGRSQAERWGRERGINHCVATPCSAVQGHLPPERRAEVGT